MDRRRYLALAGTGLALSVAGCSGDSEPQTDGGDSEADAPNVDTGVVYEGDLSELRDWTADVVQSQTVSVTASDIAEGEKLDFQVGDGASFVHSYTFYSEDAETTDEYEFESDGQHQLQLSPGRHEAPVDKDVTISVVMELSNP